VSRWLYRLSERAFDGMLHAYQRVLDWVLRHQRWVQLITLGAVGLTVFLFVTVPKGLFPQQDNGMIMGFSEAPQDVSFPAMRERQQVVNTIVGADPDVQHVVSFIGSGTGSTANTGTVFVELKDKPPRRASADQIIARLRPKLAQIEGVNLYLQAAQDVRIGGRSARTQYQYTLQDADLDELRSWAPRVVEQLRKVPELKDVVSDQQTAGLQLSLAIDRDTASRVGVTPQLIDDTLYDAYGQRQVATTFTQLNQYRRLSSEARLTSIS
jgi:hydrophobic/amphiphilic exporter-1 (mainly G- bacteria), HAE1 family